MRRPAAESATRLEVTLDASVRWRRVLHLCQCPVTSWNSGSPPSGGRGSCRAAPASSRVPWLAAQQELRPPAKQGSTRIPSLDGALVNWSKQPHGHKWRCPTPDYALGFTDQIKRATDLWREAAHRSERQAITTFNCGEVLRFTGKCPIERKNTTAVILWHWGTRVEGARVPDKPYHSAPR